MKKLFYCLAFVAATLTLAACGGKNADSQKAAWEMESADQKGLADAPEAIQEYVQKMHADMTRQSLNFASFDGIDVRDNYIVCTFTVDEDQMGMSFPEFVQAQGASMEDFQNGMKAGLLYSMQQGEDAPILRENEYNVVLVFQGSNSGERSVIEIDYNEL